MRRRSLLSAAGTLGAALVAGCMGAPSDSAGTTTAATPTSTGTTTLTPTGTTTTAGSFEFDPGTGEPFEEIEVGDRGNVLLPGDNRPHSVSVWNTVAAERELRLRVTDDGATALDRTVAFPADGYLTVTLLEPGSYEVSLFADDEPIGELSFGTGWFDCNDSTTNVGVFEDRVEHVSMATTAACRPPNVADHSFAVTGTRCGERNEGSISIEGKTAYLDGHLRTPDPCHGADLSVDDYDAGEFGEPAPAITLLVSPTTSGEACQQCVGEVTYEGAVTFEGEVPDEVVLVHEGNGEQTEVARR